MSVKRTERRYGPGLVQGAFAGKTPSLEIFLGERTGKNQ